MSNKQNTALTVNGEGISVEEAFSLLKQHMSADPTDKTPWYSPVVNEFIIPKIAKREGISKIADAELEAGINAIREAMGAHSAKDFEAWLKLEGVTLDDVERGVETNLLAEKLADKVVGDLSGRFPRIDDQAKHQIRRILLEPFLAAEREKLDIRIG
jgi:hypothetical protein